MKKQVKKLKLAKETLRSLEEAKLGAPQGGTQATYQSALGTICVCGSGHRPCFNTQQYSCPC